jgi:glycosyltransferase involved in cell wall biosynthesis
LIKMEKHGSKISLIAAGLSETLNYKYSDRIIAVTPNIKNYIKTKYQISDNKIFVVENGSNIDLFSPKSRTQAIGELCLDIDRQYICAVCSFHMWQGIEYLIQATPHILNECPGACLLIVGDGLMKEKWTQLAFDLGISDRVIFPGTIAYEKVPVYINASDVCVVYKKPLKSGYSPLKLYEYMACGKPVVASRVEGFEILEQNDAGITIEPENPEELSKAIIKLLKDEKLRYEMGTNGREYVINNHSWASVAKTVEEVCKNAFEKHGV